MTEKGIVIAVDSGRAQVKLEPPPGISQEAKTTLLELNIQGSVFAGMQVTVLLSPPHSIRAKPWPLVIAMVIFFFGVCLGIKFLGFSLALASLMIRFYKTKEQQIYFEPVIIQTKT